MANDDRQSQLFIREVDEELRREQLKSIWDRFAPLIIGVCVLVVALTAGYRGWDWWQARQAAAAGDRFTAAVQALESGNRTEGEAQLAQIAESGDDGYAALARLRLAGEKAAAGAKPEALAAYDAIAADANVAESLRSLARIRASLLALDTGDVAGARERAEPLNQSGGSWRHAAREVLGTAAYQAGELQQARDRFNEIQQDAETPPDLWMRSGMMLAVIDGALPAPGAPPAPAGIAPPAEAAPVEGALPVAPGEPPAAAVPPGAAPAPAAESSAVEPAAGEPPPNPESAPLQPAPAPAPSADPLPATPTAPGLPIAPLGAGTVLPAVQPPLAPSPVPVSPAPLPVPTSPPAPTTPPPAPAPISPAQPAIPPTPPAAAQTLSPAAPLAAEPVRPSPPPAAPAIPPAIPPQ